MPIDVNGAAAAAPFVEGALSRQRGAAANWEAANEYLPAGAGAGAAPAEGLELRSVVPLPPAFVSQAGTCAYKSFMGLFPDIGRAWLTADSRLFLWSYGEDTVLRGAPTADDFYAYDGFSQIIVAVALVRPRRDVFIDDVNFLIAVATPAEVTLLGVSFAGGAVGGELSLIPTNISVPTDGVVMLSMSSSPDGRVFMAGNDGNLHEFVYYGQPSGWASALLGGRAAKRPRKLLHRQTSLMRYVIPPALKEVFAPTDELVDMVVDSPRNALYTLSAAGCLSVYDIADANYVRLVRSVDLATHAKSVLSYSLPASEREFISIFPVPPRISNAVHLVVVSSFGERLYFATSRSAYSGGGTLITPRGFMPQLGGPYNRGYVSPTSTGDVVTTPVAVGSKRSSPDTPFGAQGNGTDAASVARPTLLRVVGYRPTPLRDVGSPASRPCFHMALWASGSVLLADLRAGDHDRLLTIFPDPAAGRTSDDRRGDHGGSGSAGNLFMSGAPGALAPLAGQRRPAEAVHELSLGAGSGAAGVNFDPMTPGRRGGNASGRAGPNLVRTFALAEVSPPDGAMADVAEGATTTRGASSMLAEPASMFWVLTSTAIRLYSRITPQQHLASILRASSGGSTDYSLDAFFAHHGTVEASALCLRLATADPSMATSAARALYAHGGKSLARSDRAGVHGGDGFGDQAAASAGLAGTPGRYSLFGLRRQSNHGSPNSRPHSVFDLGRPSQRPSTPAAFSGVHDGVCLYLAHALRPLWSEYICSSRVATEYQSMTFSLGLLEEARDAICNLVSFLDRFDPDAMLPFDEDDGTGPTEGHRDSSRGWDTPGVRGSNPLQFDTPHQNTGGDSAFGGHGAGFSRSGVPSTPMSGVVGPVRGGQDRGYGRSGGQRPKKSSEARRAEVGAIHNVKQLALRCSEAVAFLSILCDHQLHRIVPALQPSVREEFVNMQFCDLVARVPGATVSAALVEVLFGSFAVGGTDMGPLCKLLQNRCQSYFDDDDMVLQGGIQRLRAASEVLGLPSLESDSNSVPGDTMIGARELQEASPAERDEAMKLAEEAVNALKPLSSRIYNIESVFGQLVRVGAVPAAIELAIAIGDGADRSSDSARAHEAYDCILKVIGALLNDVARSRAEGDVSGAPMDLLGSGDRGRGDASRVGNGAGGGGTPGGIGGVGVGSGAGVGQGVRSAERRKDACMRIALASGSQTFHERLYTFLMSSKDGERELLSRASSKIDSFLRSKGRQDLMWRYYSQHGRHSDAATVLVSMAEEEDENVRLVDRVGFLSRALHNARTALSSGDPKAAALEADIKDYMDVARVQMRLREELSRTHERSTDTDAAQAELDAKVLDLTVLYNDYAIPYTLLEASLDVLRCGSYRDDEQVRQLWTRIVDAELESSNAPPLVAGRVVALGREFYPSDVVFPVGYLTELLERRGLERGSDAVWAAHERGWVSQALLDVGVPLGDVVDAYRAMIESAPRTKHAWSWAGEDAQLHAIGGAERALSVWAERAGAAGEERRTLVAEAEKALRTVALCKSRLRGMSNAVAAALVQRFDWIEAGISAPY